MLLAFLVTTLGFISPSLQISSVDSPSYIAGVVEYRPFYGGRNLKEFVAANVENYVTIIKKAAQFNVDVLVFPELSLHMDSTIFESEFSDEEVNLSERFVSIMPDPEEEVVPCDDPRYQAFVKEVSCAARNNNIYVLINHHEKVDCATDKSPTCENSKRDFLIYNTNLVFDRQGKVISRYRKFNLYNESYVTKPEQAIPTTFETDFGVTFGHFICFDIVFDNPALKLTKDLKIRDILYPSHWPSSKPLAFSTQTQAAWAYANDVNLLAAGFDDPSKGSGGSGVYLGRDGLLAAYLPRTPSTVMIVSEIPKVINGKRKSTKNSKKTVLYRFLPSELSISQDSLRFSHNLMLWKENLKYYTTKLIDLNKKVQIVKVCDRGLCCQFTINIEDQENDPQDSSSYLRYRLAAFKGVKTMSATHTGGLDMCGVLSCVNDTLNSCGELSDDARPSTFEYLKIEMPAQKNDDGLHLPATFTTDFLPLKTSDFTMEKEESDDSVNVVLTLENPVDKLYSFAIVKRDFNVDGSKATPIN